MRTCKKCGGKIWEVSILEITDVLTRKEKDTEVKRHVKRHSLLWTCSNNGCDESIEKPLTEKEYHTIKKLLKA